MAYRIKHQILKTLLALLFVQTGLAQKKWVEGEKWIEAKKEITVESNKEHVIKNIRSLAFPVTLWQGEIFINKEKGTEGSRFDNIRNDDYIIFNNDTLRFGDYITHCEPIASPNKELYEELLKLKDGIFKKQKGKETLEIDVSEIDSLLKQNQINTEFHIILRGKNRINFDSLYTHKTKSAIGYQTRLFIPGLPSIFLSDSRVEQYEPNILFSIKDTLDNGLVIGTDSTNSWYEVEKEYLVQKSKRNNGTYSLKPNITKELDPTKEYSLSKSSFFKESILNRIGSSWVKTTKLKTTNILVVAILALAILAFLTWLFLVKYLRQTEIFKYDEGLEKFVRKQGISPEKLKKLNSRALKKYNLEEPENLKGNDDILRGLDDKKLITGNWYKKQKSVENANSSFVDKKDVSEFPLETFESLFQKYSDRIIEEIQSFKVDDTQNDMAKKLDEFKTHNESLEKKNVVLNNTIKKNEEEKEQLKLKLHKKSEDLKLYEDAVHMVDPGIQTIGKNYSKLFHKLKEAQKEIISIVSRNSDKMSSGQSKVVLHILSCHSPIGFNDWIVFLDQLAKGKVLSDSSLSNTIMEHDELENKVRYLKIGAYKNLWQPLSSALFLQLEHLRILEKITDESNKFSQELVKTTAELIGSLRNELRDLANLSINYIPILSNYEVEPFTKVSSKEAHNMFKKMRASADDVIEIVSFGFKNINGFEDDTTEVIIKS